MTTATLTRPDLTRPDLDRSDLTGPRPALWRGTGLRVLRFPVGARFPRRSDGDRLMTEVVEYLAREVRPPVGARFPRRTPTEVDVLYVAAMTTPLGDGFPVGARFPRYA